MSDKAEPVAENISRAPAEIVAGRIVERLVNAGLLDATRAAGFEKALGQGRIKIEDLRFDIEKTDR